MGFLHAKRYVVSVDKIDPHDLYKQGIRCVLLDRDNTCVPRDRKTAPQEVLAWIKTLKDLGIVVWMVSNNAHVKQVARSAEELGVGYIAFALKPLPFAITRALRDAGFDPNESILVGDQLFTDVLGARLAGIAAILVRPQSTEDLWYTKLFRHAENIFLNNISFEGE